MQNVSSQQVNQRGCPKALLLVLPTRDRVMPSFDDFRPDESAESCRMIIQAGALGALMVLLSSSTESVRVDLC